VVRSAGRALAPESAARSGAGEIRIGLSGWRYPPWRGTFYPRWLPQRRELEYASRRVSTIEINGSFYSLQRPEFYARWRDETPDGFVFAVKGPRFVTHMLKLRNCEQAVANFFASGIANLGDKLGPILWQFAPTKKFDPDDFGAFLELLPEKQDGVRLRHAVEVRNDSFVVPEFAALLRKHDVAVVYADHEKYPAIADVTGDFVYARLQTGSDDIPTCYSEKALDEWAARAKLWAEGKAPDDLPLADPSTHAEVKPRDVFVYFITSGKVRAPHGAMAFMERA